MTYVDIIQTMYCNPFNVVKNVCFFNNAIHVLQGIYRCYCMFYFHLGTVITVSNDKDLTRIVPAGNKYQTELLLMLKQRIKI